MVKTKPVYAFEEADSKNRMLLGGKPARVTTVTKNAVSTKGKDFALSPKIILLRFTY